MKAGFSYDEWMARAQYATTQEHADRCLRSAMDCVERESLRYQFAQACLVEIRSGETDFGYEDRQLGPIATEIE